MSGAGKEQRRKVGRPLNSGERGKSTYHGKCDVRLTKQEDQMLDYLANTNGVTRSDVMRMALKDLFKYCTEE